MALVLLVAKKQHSSHRPPPHLGLPWFRTQSQQTLPTISTALLWPDLQGQPRWEVACPDPVPLLLGVYQCLAANLHSLFADPCQLLKPMVAWKMTVGKMAVTDQQRWECRDPQLLGYPFTRLKDNFYMQTVQIRLLGFINPSPLCLN